MPNRILKESICTSPTIDALPSGAELFFYRLIVQCDDFGRMDARPSILRARCFPLRVDSVSDQAVAGWLNELVEVGLVWTYRAEGQVFLQVAKWSKHQQMRAKRSKFPQPPADAGRSEQPPATDIHGYQALSDDINSTRESESESESESLKDSGALRAPPAEKIDWQAALADLERRFLVKTGLPVARRKTREEKAAAGKRWWQPLRRILELTAGDTAAAWALVEAAVDRMRAERLTISAPASVEKTVEAIVGERKTGGNHATTTPGTPGRAGVRGAQGLHGPGATGQIDWDIPDVPSVPGRAGHPAGR